MEKGLSALPSYAGSDCCIILSRLIILNLNFNYNDNSKIIYYKFI